MDKFEADDQLAKWQQAFVQATPKVDSAALIAQTQKSRTKLKLKGLIDSFLGVVVTVFCIYAMLFEAKNTYETIMFALLVPIPLGFGIWSYRLRRKLWRAETLDVNAMLNFKENQLKHQIHYWHVSFIGCVVLWCALLIVALFNMVMFKTYSLWLIQLGINGIIVLAVYIRYKKLKTQLAVALESIQAMR